jgi:hypothetical protein
MPAWRCQIDALEHFELPIAFVKVADLDDRGVGSGIGHGTFI